MPARLARQGVRWRASGGGEGDSVVDEARTDTLPQQSLLAGRYRLIRRLPDLDPSRPGSPAPAWRGEDEVLARPVAVRVLPVAGAEDGRAFLEAAITAGRLAEPRIASTYDAAYGEDANGAWRACFVVREWVEGTACRDLLLDGGPLPPAEAVRIVREAAEAVSAAADHGVHHGHLHPGNVFLTATNQVKVTDFEVAAALNGAILRRPGEPNQHPPAAGPDGAQRLAFRILAARDTRGLAAVLYALLTGHWPFGRRYDLAAAPLEGGRPAAPRQLRAGIPRDLDGLVVRALGQSLGGGSPVTTPRELVAALSGVAVTPRPAASTASIAAPRRRSRWLRIGLPAVLVVGITALGYALGLGLGRLPGQGGSANLPAFTRPSAGASGSQPPGNEIPLDANQLSVFDPPPGDGHEVDDRLRLAVDPGHDTSTFWPTETYQSGPRFAGGKSGVGVVVDLGQVMAVRDVRLVFVDPGTSVELRAADQRGSVFTDFPVVASADNASTTLTLTPPPGPPHRYWLIWLTALPRVSSGYRAEIADITFER